MTDKLFVAIIALTCSAIIGIVLYTIVCDIDRADKINKQEQVEFKDNQLEENEKEILKMRFNTLDEDIYPYISTIIDVPIPQFEVSPNGYSYRSVLDKVYPDGEWMFVDRTNDEKVEMYAQFSVYIPEEGYLKVVFYFEMGNNEENATKEIKATFNDDEIIGRKILEPIIGEY